MSEEEKLPEKGCKKGRRKKLKVAAPAEEAEEFRADPASESEKRAANSGSDDNKDDGVDEDGSSSGSASSSSAAASKDQLSLFYCELRAIES